MAAAGSIGAGAPPGVRWRRGRGERREGAWVSLAAISLPSGGRRGGACEGSVKGSVRESEGSVRGMPWVAGLPTASRRSAEEMGAEEMGAACEAAAPVPAFWKQIREG